MDREWVVLCVEEKNIVGPIRSKQEEEIAGPVRNQKNHCKYSQPLCLKRHILLETSYIFLYKA